MYLYVRVCTIYYIYPTHMCVCVKCDMTIYVCT